MRLSFRCGAGSWGRVFACWFGDARLCLCTTRGVKGPTANQMHAGAATAAAGLAALTTPAEGQAPPPSKHLRPKDKHLTPLLWRGPLPPAALEGDAVRQTSGGSALQAPDRPAGAVMCVALRSVLTCWRAVRAMVCPAPCLVLRASAGS